MIDLVTTQHTTQIEKIRSIIDASESVLVVAHIDPDGDSLGTQLAFGAYLKDLGKTVTMLRDGEIPHKYQFLHGVQSIGHIKDVAGQPEFDTAVVLECPSLKRVGRPAKFLSGDVRVINIDHHLDNDQFGEVVWMNTGASSVGEMAAEYFSVVGYELRAEVAELLYTAVMTDTGRFRFSSTSARTMVTAGKLIEAGADPQRICDAVYFDVKVEAIKLMGKVLNGIEFHDQDRVCVLTLTKEIVSASGASVSDAEGLVDYTLFSRGVIIGILVKELDSSTTKVSLRSKNGIDVAALAGRFGGGGHANAAGCVVPLDLQKAKAEIIKLAAQEVASLDE